MDNFINFAEYSYFRIMYDYIKGRIEELNPTEAVIECCGIGYLMQISLNTYEKIRDAGDTRLYVYHHVREDEETLFGFFDKEERRIFILLISVSGIGPNTARMMLSSLTPDEVSTAVATGDVNRIKAVKGIGLKTAQKVIIELKDKISRGSGPAKGHRAQDCPKGNHRIEGQNIARQRSGSGPFVRKFRCQYRGGMLGSGHAWIYKKCCGKGRCIHCP